MGLSYLGIEDSQPREPNSWKRKDPAIAAIGPSIPSLHSPGVQDNSKAYDEQFHSEKLRFGFGS